MGVALWTQLCYQLDYVPIQWTLLVNHSVNYLVNKSSWSKYWWNNGTKLAAVPTVEQELTIFDSIYWEYSSSKPVLRSFFSFSYNES